MSEKKSYVDFVIPNNRKVLNFSIINNNGTSNLLFGEYFNNSKKKSVNIWRIENINEKWDILYTFPDGIINHVHNIVQINGGVYVLTGDFGDASAIWLTNFYFSNFNLLVSGLQTYRATWINKIGDDFYYATDSQLEQNHFISFKSLNTEEDINKIFKIPGSSIYSATSFDCCKLIFSTSVECGEPSGHLIRDIFSRQLGPGIATKFAYVFEYDSRQNILSEVFQLSKDFLPFRLFQFGSFMFPTGHMPENRILIYCNALSDYDNCTLVLKK